MDMQAAEALSTALYLEDLPVGRRFRSGRHMLDEAQIKAFAQQFDPQPFHLDEALAAQTLFGALAASGWHTAALTMRLLVTSELRIAGGLIGAGAEISWPMPTRPGDELYVESEVIEVTLFRSRHDRGLVTVRSETFNQRGDVLQRMVSKLIAQRKAA